MIGEILNDRYRIDAEIGQGGMGTVYRGYDTDLEREVAIKVLTRSGLGTEGRGKLISEAQMAAKLNHPNIVTVHDVGEEDSSTSSEQAVPFIVMEYVEGNSLHENRPETINGTLEIMRQVCAGLDHAHGQGIIHRDLKPENVVMTRDGTAKLMDFGLARSMASRYTSDGLVAGTVFYMAPEQALGQEIDQRTDLYSLGVMLYELTTGELPFVDQDPIAVISQHLHAPVVPPRAKNDEISPVLDALIVGLLNKDAGDRPASAKVVLSTLESPDILDIKAIPDKEFSVLDRIVRGRIVARDKELREARELWHRVGRGEGQLLLISGEPGIGKTRFMHEIVTHAEVSGGIALLGECYTESNAPYNPFSQITRHLLTGDHHNGLQMPDAVLDDLLKLTPDLRHQYSKVQPNPRLGPEIEQQRLFENMATFCSTLAEKAPLLLVIEDVHWADSGTLAMLHHLIRRTQEQPVMILITYREVELKESRSFYDMLLELNRQRQGIRLKLERLDRDKTRVMLAAIFAEEITPEFLDGIYHETDGNPFFIEEVCRTLVDSGAVYYQDGQWHSPNIEELEIPHGVQAAVESRIAKMQKDHQEVLRMAAILGREFSFNILLESLDLDEDILIEAIEAADKAQMVQEVDGIGDVKFTFVHALVPSAIVECLSTLRRRKLHRQAVTAIEKFSPEDYESLAYHSDQAGDYKRAFKYFVLAAQRATSLYAYEEAIRYATQAIEMAPEVSQDNVMLAKLYQSRALACETIGRFHQALGDFETTLQIVREEGEQRLEWRILLDLGKLWASQDYNQSKDYYEQALNLARQMDDPEVLAGSLNWMGNWHANAENLSQAVDYHQQALEIFEVLDDKQQLANTLDLLGISNLLAGDCEASVEYYDRAITLFKELDDRARLASSLTGRGNLGGAVYTYSTVAPSFKPGEARRDFEEALHINRQLGSLPGEAWLLWSLGLTFWVQGELGQALEAAQRGLGIASDIGHREWIVGNQTILGFLYVELFAPGEAKGLLEQALGLAEELRSVHWIYRAMGTLAATHHLLGDLGQAQSCLDAVISPQTLMDTIVKRYCWAREAELKLAQGDPALALDITERLIRSAPGIQPGGVITYLWKLKGEAHAALGQFEEAKSLLWTAKENAQENEERFLLWQIHASLGKVFYHLKAQASCEEELLTARALIEKLADTLSDQELKQEFMTGANNTLTTL